MIDLIIIAYGIKSKVFKQSSSVRLHVNWLSVPHNYFVSIFQIVIMLLS